MGKKRVILLPGGNEPVEAVQMGYVYEAGRAVGIVVGLPDGREKRLTFAEIRAAEEAVKQGGDARDLTRLVMNE